MADWDKIKSRGRVSDKRSQRSGGGIFGKSGGSVFGRTGGSTNPQQLPMNLNGMSGKTVVLVVIAMILFTALSNKLSEPSDGSQADSGSESSNSLEKDDFDGADQYEVFVATVLGSNNDYWEKQFDELGEQYREPELVLFRDYTDSACGGASSSTGPHYCPANETIYIDERFFDDVLGRFGSDGGDVAEAYIIGHEVGHHAQHLLGLTDELNKARTSLFNRDKVNELSVELELQADCFSGLWANSINDLGIFGPDEIKEAIGAAAAVGDDRIQETTTGRVDPESWTHGSSEQRVQWFNTGWVTGEYPQCQI